MIYKIKIEESLSRVIEIEAENINDAIGKVDQMYSNEDIILDYNDLDYTDITEYKGYEDHE